MTTQRTTRLGCIALLAIMSLTIGVIAVSAQSVPATAREAAKLPQFATKLAHPIASQKPAPARHPAEACPMLARGRGKNNSPLDILYSNGPINGTTDAWTINFGFIISDTFPVGSSGGTVSGLTFGAWLFPGDVLQSVEVSVTSAEFGGTTYFDGVVNLSQSGCIGNQYGYNVCTATSASFGPVGLPQQGTYWMNLQNAVTNTGDPVYWDENSGPSMASENAIGTIPSEAFEVLGTDNNPNRCMPEQQANFKVIHDFNGADGANPSGVAVDTTGNLYGPIQPVGGNGAVFKMAPFGSGWILSDLYNFTGGDNGSTPAGVMVGRNGIIYGAASGADQSCVGQSCGMIFSLRPSPTVCRSISCYWAENIPYHFTASTDAWQGNGLVQDHAGNLYGVSYSGGAQQQGAIFQLAPSIGGWVETILYSFTGGADGANPTSIVIGNDGSLYGTAATGGINAGGVVFQLTPSGSGWSQSVLYAFGLDLWGEVAKPHSLVQDSAGNLFGAYSKGLEYPMPQIVGVVFMLTPSNGVWGYSELHQGNNPAGTDAFGDLAVDSLGNLFGTGGGTSGCIPPLPEHGYIFKLARTNDGWQYSTPVSWGDTYFHVSGALALDAHGNLYGTTGDCGSYNKGTVWQLTP